MVMVLRQYATAAPIYHVEPGLGLHILVGLPGEVQRFHRLHLRDVHSWSKYADIVISAQ